jgi:hypothetical protein
MAMLTHFNEYDLHKTRGDDLQRAAEQHSQAQETHPRPPFYAPALAGMGKVLVEVGSKLQEQYQERSTVDDTVSPAAKASLSS